MGNRQWAIYYIYIYIINNKNDFINNEQNINNDSSYVVFCSLKRLWAQFAMRGWSRSGFLLQMQIKSFDLERFSCKIHSLKGILFQSFTLQIEIESRFLAKTTP